MTADRAQAPITYPSFYRAVHAAWNDLWARQVGTPNRIDRCTGFRTRHHRPDEHACFELAAALRVELHAAGITLSIDGNGSGMTGLTEESGFRELLDGPELRRRIGAEPTMMWIDSDASLGVDARRQWRLCAARLHHRRRGAGHARGEVPIAWVEPDEPGVIYGHLPTDGRAPGIPFVLSAWNRLRSYFGLKVL